MTYPTFTTGEVLTAAAMNAVGLWKITSVSFTNATSASPVDIVGCFSSDYTNYEIMFNTTAGTANAEVGCRLLSGTTPAAGSDYRWAGTGSTNTNASSDGGTLTQTYFPVTFLTANGTVSAPIRCFQPQVAVRTVFVSDWLYDDGGTLISRRYHGQHNLAVSYTGLRIYTLTGSMTGTATVYGYRK